MVETKGLRRTFRYKARLSPSAERNAVWMIDRLRELYNAGLQERRDAWQMCRETVGFYAQSAQLKDVRRIRPEYAGIDFLVCEDALRRLQRAFDGFFRRVKAGKTPGYPRFRGRARYNSVTFRKHGWKLDGRYLTLRGIGRLKLFLSRPIEGKVKTVTLKRDRCGDWFVTFSCDDVAAHPLPDTDSAVGVDVGLASFLTTSDGDHVENPRHLRVAEAELKRAQRKVSKKKRGGSNRRRAVTVLARRHRKVRRARRDFHFKTALALVRAHDLIAAEDLSVSGLARTRMAKSVHDAGWDQFLAILAAKAEEAGREFVSVDPRGTSQVCSDCGAEPETHKRLWHRVHECGCGLTLDRDVNAARNILARAGPVASRPCSQVEAWTHEPTQKIGRHSGAVQEEDAS
jgi:putative transposase